MAISNDLLLEKGYEKTRRRNGEPEWECHFFPKEYLQDHPNMDLDKSKLSEERMAKWG